MKKPQELLTGEELQRIEQAVRAAEQKTAGEIVPMVVSASSRYAEIDLAGLSIGLVIGTLASFAWHDPWASIHSQLLWPLAGAAAGYALCCIPGLKRRFIPDERVAEAVQLRSLAAFTGQGLHHTRAETGILIFVSLLEHRVVVLADRGINEKVATGTWEEIVRIITDGLKSGRACEAFCRAIERCGEILASHFPRAADDRDELANKLVTDA
jgi:putative membrane protein